MPTMTSGEREDFLAEVHVGVIAVERPNRAPLAVPVWYCYHPGGEIVIWTETGSVKERLIRAAGRFSLSVQSDQWPYRYVTAEGSVTSVEPLGADTARAITVRYLGEEKGARWAEESITPDSVAICMRPERWLSTDYSKE